MRYFEDFHVGEHATLGSHAITRDEILAFARQFDPQPFHVDEERAKASIYGGLIASGWHTASLMMRLIVDGWANDTAGMGSPGVDDLRWLVPVRPGDTLTASITVREVTPSTRRTDRGSVHSLCELRNQDGQVVLRAIGINIVARRPAAG
ncbi:MAG TPA: MaoC family dehydratase [Ktedonobacterales bacterium]|nr:MaoC family dehydratase [Ktedonobacterales bacterium]